jgi:hypothetical protein
MIFEDAVEEAMKGMLIQREEWIGPIWMVSNGLFRTLNHPLDEEDLDAEDWIVVGCFQ